MSIPPSIQDFWNSFTATLGQDPAARWYEAFHFHDTAAGADELAALVLAGKKRATAGLLWAYEAEGKALPKPGDLSVVTLFSGQPVCVIETRSVEIWPFSQVGADFAATEGEGDGSLAVRQTILSILRHFCVRLGRFLRTTIRNFSVYVCDRGEVRLEVAEFAAPVSLKRGLDEEVDGHTRHIRDGPALAGRVTGVVH